MTAIYISTFAALVSLISACFAVYSWLKANRPLITVRVTTADGGNVSTAFNLLIENTGNQPARNIRLYAEPRALNDAMDPNRDRSTVKDPERVFRATNIIPVLANGRSTMNAFGLITTQGPSTWRVGAKIPIVVRYNDLGRREFKSEFTLIVADDSGFAQTTWG